MSETYELPPPGWFARARYTPLWDVLRGQISGSLDVRSVIAAAELATPLPGLVYRVVRRTRLWRREQFDVARELTAHFAAGLEAGKTPVELADDFGPPERAALLIRRAKLRNRPLWWQTLRLIKRLLLGSIGVCVLVYCLFAVRLFFARPNIAHNYWNDINAARRTDERDRAWPLYRQALLLLGKTDIDPDVFDDGSPDTKLAEAIESIEAHQDALQLARQAATKPRLSYLWGDPTDRVAAAAAAHQELLQTQNSADNEALIAALIPGVQELRRIARLLVADARRAALAGDGTTALDDLTALVSLSEQMFEPSASLVEQMVGLAIIRMTLDSTRRILFENSMIWSDEQLRDLAHRIATFRGGSWSADLTMEQMAFDDLLQRAYTDDGNGNGRITPQGLRMLAEFSSYEHLLAALQGRGSSNALTHLIGPGMAAWIGSREENRALYHSTLAAIAADHQGPPWQWKQHNMEHYGPMFGPPTKSPTALRYWLVSLMLPAVDAVFTGGEREHQWHDATLAAIALELWHRRHGNWPATLDDLVPTLLPAVPVDRMDGKALRYVLRDGRPVLYSVGNDRFDGGGAAAAEDSDDEMVPRFGIRDAKAKQRLAPGDWILWPPVKKKPAEPETMPSEADPPAAEAVFPSAEPT